MSSQSPESRAAERGEEQDAASGEALTVATGAGSSTGDDSGATVWLPFKVAVVVAVAVGTVLRFVVASPLWLDEALSVNIASLPPADIAEALRHDGHPPLYYFLLHYWMELFGPGDTSTRALSGLFSLATLPLAWVVGKRRGGVALAWAFVGLLGASGFGMRYGSEARMYALVSFLMLALYLLVDDVTRRAVRNGPRLVGIALLAGGLLLTHYWAMWLLAAGGIVLLWAWRRSDDPRRRAGAIRSLGAMVAGSVIFLWWVPTMLYQSQHTGTPWSQPVRPSVAASIVVVDFAAGTGFADAPVLAVFTGVVFALGLFGVGGSRSTLTLDLRGNRRVRTEALLLGLTVTTGIAIGYVAKSAFASRYASVVQPLFVLVVAAGVTCFADRRVRLAVFTGLVAAGLLGGTFNAFYFRRTQAGVNAEAIRAAGKPGDVVVYCPDQLGPAGLRALGDGFDAVSYPTLGDPRFVDWVDYKARNEAVDPTEIARKVLERAGPDRTIFVVDSPSYATYEGQCETFLAELGKARPDSGKMVEQHGGRYFEPSSATRFGPVRP